MADDPKTPAKDDDDKPARHEHVWASFVSGDGSAAVHTTRCTVCDKEKKDS